MITHYKIKEQDVVDFANSQGIRAKRIGDECAFLYCPYCRGGSSRDKWTFYVNTKTGQYECKRSSCGVKGNMITLARDFDFNLSDEFSAYYRKRPTYRNLPQPKSEIIPKPAAVSYLEQRGISEETAKAYKVTVQTDKESVMCFPVYDENGKMVNVKYRNLNYTKDKKNGIKEWYEQNCIPYLYGIQTWDGTYDRMILTEGQLDAMACHESGIPNSFSVPGGAKGFTWYPPSYEFVSQFKEMVIFGDYENGKITLLEEMKQRFGGLIKHVREEDYKDCKDANDILLKYGKEQIQKCIENAVMLPVTDIIELADVEDVDISKLEKLPVGIRQVDRLLYGGLPFGGVHLISGKPGQGKSTLASQILVGAIERGYKVFAYSGELPNYLFKAWLFYQIAGGNHVFESGDDVHEPRGFSISEANKNVMSNWIRGKAYIYDNGQIDEDEHQALLKTTEDAIRRYGCRVVLIDNLMTALDLEMTQGDDKYERQSKFVKKLTRIALKYNVLVLLVAHKRKNNFSTNQNDEISGSGDIANLGMVTISYDKSDDIDESERLIRIAKNRLFGRTNESGYLVKFDERSKRIYGDGDDKDIEYGCFKKDFAEVDDMMEIPF